MKRGRKAPPAPKPAKVVPKEKLARAIDPIAEDYIAFVSTQPEGERPGDSKAFAARHSAGLTALAHLTELATLVSDDASPDAVQATVESVLEAARARMQEEGRGGEPSG